MRPSAELFFITYRPSPAVVMDNITTVTSITRSGFLIAKNLFFKPRLNDNSGGCPASTNKAPATPAIHAARDCAGGSTSKMATSVTHASVNKQYLTIILKGILIFDHFKNIPPCLSVFPPFPSVYLFPLCASV